MATTIILSSGYKNSDKQHWQSHLERKYKNVIRIQQQDWYNPERKVWLKTVAETIEAIDGKAILVGHSCGSVSITQWVEQYPSQTAKITATILVAPADVDAPDAIAPIQAQRPLSLKPLPFPSTLVCSDNDEHASLERSHYFAKQWGSKLITLTHAGHINSEAGYGDWPLIEELIETTIDESLILK